LMRQKKLSSMNGLVGLRNLGNTCYMNSSVQCLSNTMELTAFFLAGQHLSELNKDNPIGTGGRVARAYGELVQSLWCESKKSAQPWDLKRTISHFAHQFSGYSQHDSHELLSFLLDALHEDLNRITTKPYVELKEAESEPDSVAAQKAWTLHKKRNDSYIVDLMHGQYKSTVTCPQCDKVSITFDPFMSMSLPIPNRTVIEISLYFCHNHPYVLPKKMTFYMDAGAELEDVAEEIASREGVEKEHIFFCLVSDNKLTSFLRWEDSIRYASRKNGVCFAYYTPINENVFKDQQPNIIPIYVCQDKPKLSRFMSYLTSSEEKNLISFPRIVVIGDLTIKGCYKEVYRAFRRYIQDVEDYPLEKIDFDNTEVAEEVIDEEMKILFAENLGINERPFRIHVSNVEESLDITDERTLHDLFEEYHDVNRYFSFDLMWPKESPYPLKRLNKCSEADEEEMLNGTNNPIPSLDDCFEKLREPERLESDNSWYCSRCKELVRATKVLEPYSLPKILVLHLKRFKSRNILFREKLSTFVRYPIRGLDLSDHIKGGAGTVNGQKAIYDLYAVSNHYGSLYGGHYTAYCYNDQRGKWYEYDDSSVEAINEKYVIHQAAYILFYKLREG